MAFRTIVVRNRCKLEYSLGYMICRGDVENKVVISEISTLIIENNAVSLTASLLNYLIKDKVKIVFCDEKHNPAFECVPYYENFETFAKIKEQINYSNDFKDVLWANIIKEKIRSEQKLIYDVTGLNDERIDEYLNKIVKGDATNREGHAAKVYFNILFGKDFSRSDDSINNVMLNYGYSIIVSQLNRCIKSLGYLTELGIHHIGETNPFNLTYDIFEPLRVLIDSYVIKKIVNNVNYKEVFINLLQKEVHIKNYKTHLDNAIEIYVKSIFSALQKENLEEIEYIKYEI